MRSAVLLSGGLDSAVLVVEEATRGDVQPIYVSVGLGWEDAERAALENFLTVVVPRFPMRPLVVLSIDMRDVYPSTHWAVLGHPPGYDTPDEDVYLPGRNIVLLSKVAVYCAGVGIPRIVLGTLDHNPFPDATPEFRAAMAAALSRGLAHPIEIDAPYGRVGKAELIRRATSLGLPLALTLSCMNRVGAGHCGVCSKCRERHEAFIEAGIVDPTIYVDRRHVGKPAAGRLRNS